MAKAAARARTTTARAGRGRPRTPSSRPAATARPRPATATRRSAPRSAAPSVRGRRRPARRGLPLLWLLVVLGVVAAMAVGPLTNYLAATDRVTELTAQRTALEEEVAELEEDRARLDDPTELELLAREELGMVRPGEIPYVVITPDPVPTPEPPAPEAPADDPWYARLGELLTGWLR